MKKTNNQIGATGESVAAAYLRQEGYLIHTVNYRGRYGEIDLVAEKDGVLAFVEVKTRCSLAFGRPSDYVTPAKIAKLTATAKEYLFYNDTDLQPRFDVVEVLTAQKGCFDQVKIHHIPSAFDVDDMD